MSPIPLLSLPPLKMRMYRFVSCYAPSYQGCHNRVLQPMQIDLASLYSVSKSNSPFPRLYNKIGAEKVSHYA